MTNFYDVKSTLEDIEEKREELKQMQSNWQSDDPYAQASSDPGLQFELENEIEELWRTLQQQVSDVVTNI